jgi:hypothetical protein
MAVAGIFPIRRDHLVGESATRPIAPLVAAVGVLLRLAHKSALRCHADPQRLPRAHSGSSNCRIEDHFIKSMRHQVPSASCAQADEGDTGIK